MSSMSRNSSVNSLMGFSVNQPAIGAPLQFFPAMGSKQLDEMIDAYVPGDASILEKRTAVSMEFFQHSIATGELFKFFMVYPTLPSANTSPIMDSDYQSSFTSSPAMSDSQWNTPYSTSSRMTSPSTSKKVAAANDFSNLPGMKIMTKDGRDVTNSASRGCKTKEQRDHAHLMRMLKACDSCRRKKTKCDPSHKRPAAGTSSGKITKKASKAPRTAPAAPAAHPPITAKEASISADFDQIFTASLPSLEFSAESFDLPTDTFSMEWDQFIQYDEEPTEAIPYNYDFFLDPAGYFSPGTTASFSSSSTSPSQVPITPIDRDVNITDTTTDGHNHKPILPYLIPGGVEAGSNYVDFNLYSPQSSFLDEDLDLMKEVAASPIQSQRLERHRHKITNVRHETSSNLMHEAGANTSFLDQTCSYRQNVISDAIGDGIFYGVTDHMNHWPGRAVAVNAIDRGGVLDAQNAECNSGSRTQSREAPLTRVSEPLAAGYHILETGTSEGLYGRNAISEQGLPRLLSGRDRLQTPIEVNTAERGAERQMSVQEASLVREPLRLNEAVSMTRADTSSPQTYADQAYDGAVPSRTSLYATTASSLPAHAPLEQVEDYVHFTRNRAPVLNERPSPLPITASRRPTRSSTSEENRQATWLDEQTSRPLTSSAALHPIVEQGSSSVPWNSGSEGQLATRVSRSFSTSAALAGPSDTLPPMSVIAGLGFLSVVVSLVSARANNARHNGLTRPAQPLWHKTTIAGAAARAVLLLCASQNILSWSASFLLMGSLAICAMTGFSQTQHQASSRNARPKAFNFSPSHTLPNTKRPHIDVIDEFKSTCTKILRIVRCNPKGMLIPSAYFQSRQTDRTRTPCTRDLTPHVKSLV
ncbi:hypothetical protein F5B22DRAFT_477353 [Xylaria bambusicola]|uniref:uncharacterized protein n=1 Tax=Xylaria bambusicola TaxID=326684 RepID=UPI0020083BA8|nr:uncharacterized protein F5B22DRAFT_477353 [Xylaria bambusicola]KAI0506194.1 hypothetical protein F5B22DRAFT_477353 [Xylaria bambusicola]